MQLFHAPCFPGGSFCSKQRNALRRLACIQPTQKLKNKGCPARPLYPSWFTGARLADVRMTIIFHRGLWVRQQQSKRGRGNYLLQVHMNSKACQIRTQRQPHTQERQPQHSTAQHSTAQHSTAQHSTAHHARPRHATPRHATPRHATPRHATVTPHHATQPHTIRTHMGMHVTVIHFSHISVRLATAGTEARGSHHGHINLRGQH